MSYRLYTEKNEKKTRHHILMALSKKNPFPKYRIILEEALNCKMKDGKAPGKPLYEIINFDVLTHFTDINF